jgi:hypothetical protein
MLDEIADLPSVISLQMLLLKSLACLLGEGMVLLMKKQFLEFID